MDRRTFISGITVGALAAPLAAQVAPERKVSRIGTLSSRAGPADALTSPFVQGVRELGYVEGQNLVIERRDADGHADRVPEFAAELVRSRVEAIVVFCPAPLAPARKATSTIPIVMAASSEPRTPRGQRHGTHLRGARSLRKTTDRCAPGRERRHHVPPKERIAQLAIENRLPGIAAFKEFTQAGLLMSYGPDLPDIQRRAAGYVDRIRGGAKAGDLPIELPNKHELLMNLNTAKALALTIPQSLLLRRTR